MRQWMLFVLLVLLMSGCSQAESGGYTAGDLRGYNHTQQGINYFRVNGYGGGVRGNTCCILLPDKWTPGLKAHVEWEVDPKTASKFPGYHDRIKFNKWKDEIETSFHKHSTIVDIPPYGEERCGITVHFLPCNQIKVTTICDGYGTPNYPIKEPLDMKEPAQCPK
ncbi:DUF3304 domain-containing protein [Pantoea agglomerans]|uniref:DUF3304 domain-containing protein n=1 Tax=Enterobacter agglomerans TaxID=549 RepID=A0ACC5RP32_ENTAG|nr:DUF3304 domain-containing protein [Pantoea agglomerans]MBK4726477.1 DUF3304 domain-containing protein [Pantoea agglomerans]